MPSGIVRAALAMSYSAVIAGTMPVEAVETFRRSCDGSAVVDVGEGHFLNATDEDNVIRLYKHGDGKPVEEFALDEFLKTEVDKKGVPKEADIEGVARLGTRLYWIGSHGRDKKGELERSRHRLFCTAQIGHGAATRLEPVGRPFTGLLRSLEQLDAPIGTALQAAEPLAPDEGGINIEGLGASVDEGLLIGFRSPLIAGKALVVELRNPAAVVEHGAEPTFAKPVLLNLGGSGIRAIEPKSDGRSASAYWLLAGPTGAGPSHLYEWQIGAEPTRRSDIVLPTDYGAGEGLMTFSGGLLAAMDGGEIGAPSCKDRPIDTRSFAIETLVK
jgi:hypothetical protein